METVTHHGRETPFVVEGGRGPPVLLVHGSGGDRGIWHRQFGSVEAVQFAALDLSGHGDSADVDADPGYTTLSAYADDVLAVADAVDARVIVGHSLGGAVLLHAAIERPLDLDGLVLSSTGARLGVLDALLEWLDHDFDRAVEFLHGTDRFFHDPDPADRELSIETMRETGQAVTRRDFRTCHRFDVRDDLDVIDHPTLVCCGEHDRLTPPWYHEYLVDELPDAERVEFADAAHMTMLERSAAFTDTVVSFASAVAR